MRSCSRYTSSLVPRLTDLDTLRLIGYSLVTMELHVRQRNAAGRETDGKCAYSLARETNMTYLDPPSLLVWSPFHHTQFSRFFSGYMYLVLPSKRMASFPGLPV